MGETDEREQAAADGAGASGDEAAELRAEEESAKAMEAEVPHPQGFENTGQEPPAESEQGQTS